MKKILMFAAVLFAFSAVAMSSDKDGETNKKGPYMTNRWYDNIFVGIGGGININVGGDWAPHNGFGNGTIAPTFDINLGKWFTPNVGTRLAVNGFWAKGWGMERDLYVRPGDRSEADLRYCTEKIWYQNYRADFLYNLCNAIQGYRSDRVWDVVPFLGFGLANSHAQEHSAWSFTVTGGILNNIRITDLIDITLEGKYMVAQTNFDGSASQPRHRVDGLASLTVGLAFNLQKNTFKRAEIPNYQPYTDQINGLKDDLASMKSSLSEKENQNKALASALAAEKNKKPEVVTTTKLAPVALFFTIGKATLSDKDLTNLDFYMKAALEDNPNRKFTITGTCDSATGSPEYNQKLSEKRTDYVADLMVKKYGVKPENITKVSLGSTKDMFKKAELNRKVMVVE